MMKPNEIRAALLIAEVKVIDIAKNLGLHYPNVSAVISGKRSMPRVRKAIADAIGKPVSEIWPDTEPSTKEKAA